MMAWPEVRAHSTMSLPGKNSHREAPYGLLPLFRQEALAAQEKSYGEILLIRPFSLMFLTCLLCGMAAAGGTFLVFGHYNEWVSVPATFVSNQSASGSARITVIIPSRWTQNLRAGASVGLRWHSCSGQSQRIPGTVTEIAPLAASNGGAESTAIHGENPMRVTIAGPAEFSSLTTSQGNLEANIPLGSRRLIHWFVSRPGS